ncbi:MAG: hypothetical protein ACM65K_28355 [Microcoleus sp.]
MQSLKVFLSCSLSGRRRSHCYVSKASSELYAKSVPKTGLVAIAPTYEHLDKFYIIVYVQIQRLAQYPHPLTT